MLDHTTGVAGCAWPGLPPGDGVHLAALAMHLEHTQWLSADDLARAQLRQLRALCAHALGTPWWRKRFRRVGLVPDALTWETFRALPILSRADLQRHEAAMRATPPASHGAVARKTSSGSTGRQVVVHRTALAQLFWNAITLRDVVWHRRDPSATFAAIRYVHDLARGRPPHGERLPSWGPPTAMIYATGPAHLLALRADTRAQAAWLREVRPDYLLSHPTNLRAVLAELGDEAATLGVRQVLTVSEMLAPPVRRDLARGFAAPVVDLYSTQEVGNIALQCPEHDHFHVQAEDVLVEVLRDDGTPCEPGEIGRVVLTPLHNFATILLRYDVGDYAQVGPPCPCGRGLPVLTRVVGRVRNMLVRPDGTRIWPFFKSGEFTEIAPIQQWQFVQPGPDRLVARLVVPRPLTAEEEAAIARMAVLRLGVDLPVTFEYPDHIPRGPGGKFEDFVSEIGS